MRINQWTNGERTGTTVEIDAYNVGHDLTRGQSTFVRVARPQLEQHDRLADPAVQQASEALDGAGDGNEADDDETRDDGAPYGLQLAADAGDDVQPEASAVRCRRGRHGRLRGRRRWRLLTPGHGSRVPAQPPGGRGLRRASVRTANGRPARRVQRGELDGRCRG